MGRYTAVCRPMISDHGGNFNQAFSDRCLIHETDHHESAGQSSDDVVHTGTTDKSNRDHDTEQARETCDQKTDQQ